MIAAYFGDRPSISLGAKGRSVATLQTTLTELDPNFPPAEAVPQMQVRKRNGSLEPVDVNKIVRAVERCCHGLPHVDPIRVASKTIGGLSERQRSELLSLLRR